MQVAVKIFESAVKRALQPRTVLNTWQWAEREVVLDSRFTNRPGLYQVGFTPYMKMPHEWFSDPRVNEITGAKSRQVAGTTFLANCMMYAVAETPGPIMYVTSTRENAQSFSEREWLPRVELCSALRKLKPDDIDDYKKTEQHFRTCTVKFVGSNSPANLMSRPIQYLFEDEVDTWPEDNGAEAPSIEIVEACTISYGHAKKIVRISTPTVPTGTIWQYFLRGSQHKYLVKSPFALDKPGFELKFEMLNFHKDKCRDEKTGQWNLDKLRRSVTLRCPYTGKDIEQLEQAEMVRNGEWVQTNPHAPSNHISWHISALYSPMLSWGDIAVLFIQKKDSPGGLHDFYNHYLGLPFERKAAEVKASDIELVRDRSPKYTRPPIGASRVQLPAPMDVILMAVDVQQDGFWWGQRGLRKTEKNTLQSWLLDYGQAVSFLDIEDLFNRKFVWEDEEIEVYKGLIDSGYRAARTGGVYEFCLKMRGGFFPCQGRAVNHGLFQPVRETIFTHKGQDFEAVQFRDDLFKEELYLRRIKTTDCEWFLPQDICPTYIEQLCDEKLVGRKTERGTLVLEWKDFGNNHMGDVEKMLLVGESLVQPFLINPDLDSDSDSDSRHTESSQSPADSYRLRGDMSL
jgi:phage terminase large subunit GpA-like protein